MKPAAIAFSITGVTVGKLELEPPVNVKRLTAIYACQNPVKNSARSGVALLILIAGSTLFGAPENPDSLREKAESGNAIAQLELGWRYQNGVELPQDDSSAIHWYQKAAEQGLASAQCNLGMMHMEGRGTPANQQLALEWLRSAARKGHTLAIYNIGLAHLNGDGVPQDLDEAVKWFRRAATDKEPARVSEAGGIYQQSDSVPWASHDRRRNINQGKLAAQNQLGLMYALGQGVEQDLEEALKWYRRAAEQDYPIAQRNLAAIYQKGQGAPQDPDESLKWFRRAAEGGDIQAQNHLGLAYATGNGIAQDLVEAFKWFTLTASRGDPYGTESRRTIMGHLTPEQIAQGEQLARESLENFGIRPYASGR